jgi:hypothetical protein
MVLLSIERPRGLALYRVCCFPHAREGSSKPDSKAVIEARRAAHTATLERNGPANRRNDSNLSGNSLKSNPIFPPAIKPQQQRHHRTPGRTSSISA